MTTSALMVIDPQTAIQAAIARYNVVSSMKKQSVLRDGIDFGIVPGTAKPTLLKPGAERLCSAFGFNPRFDTITAIERWDGDEPLFYYRIRCTLIHIDTGLEVATGIGSCNSREARYRWRWVRESDVPAGLDKSALVSRNASLKEFAFAVDKAETGGKYGKPAAYWQRFKDAIAAGTAKATTMTVKSGKAMDAWEIGGTEYRIPNDDIFSLVNTIDKIAAKRALIAATLIGANASEFFTQDVEDLPEFGGMVDSDGVIVDAEYTVVDHTPSEPPAMPKGTSRSNPYDAAMAERPTEITVEVGSFACHQKKDRSGVFYVLTATPGEMDYDRVGDRKIYAFSRHAFAGTFYSNEEMAGWDEIGASVQLSEPIPVQIKLDQHETGTQFWKVVGE